MGKYYDKLKTGDPNREVSSEELRNVLGEFFMESTEQLRQSRLKVLKILDEPNFPPKRSLLNRIKSKLKPPKKEK